MRKPLAIALIVLLILAVAGGVVYTLRAKGKPALAEPPRAEEPKDQGQVGGALPNEGRAPTAEAAPNTKPVVQCAGPLPERSRVQFSDLPVAKLGEWLELKNKDGKVALRFKVDLLDMAQTGYAELYGVRTPTVSGLFLMRVENLSCEDLNWPIRRGGMWISWTEAHPRDVSVAWQDVDTGGSMAGYVDVLLQDQGKFNSPPEYQSDADVKATQLILNRAFGKTTLKEIPASVPAGQGAEFEMVISTSDPFLQWGKPIGLYGDGRYFLALGGELSWGMIDLGRAQDWIKQTGLRVERP